MGVVRKINKSIVSWKKAYKIIRYPYKLNFLFEISSTDSLPLLLSSLKITSGDFRKDFGEIELLPSSKLVGGPGSSYLMVPFMFLNASRFTDGSFGVLYAGNQINVAVYETIHHHCNAMKNTVQSPGWLSRFQLIEFKVTADLHDLRSGGTAYLDILRADADYKYDSSRSLARTLRDHNSDGIVYPSVRYFDGECVALFYPNLASSPKTRLVLEYYWDGRRVSHVRSVENKKSYRIEGQTCYQVSDAPL